MDQPENGLPTFDEDFVRAGPVELSATQRAIEQARQASAERAQALREQQRQAALANRRSRRQLVRSEVKRAALIVVALSALGAGVWWVAGDIQRSPSVTEPVTQTGPPGVTLPSDVTTTTSVSFANFDYPPGACVTWDQSLTGEIATTQVACSKPHLIEVASGPFSIAGFGTAYPAEASLDSYYIKHCTAPIQRYLGYAVDPNGRFDVAAVGPTAADWAGGDRIAWCDLQLGSNTKDLVPFVGVVRGANQELIYPVGSCGGAAAAPVPCSARHTWQVAGNINVSASAAFPTTDSAWQELVGSECDSLALKFLGGSYPAGVQGNWLSLQASSWAAGERTVQCIVAHYPANGGNALPSTGSLAGAAR